MTGDVKRRDASEARVTIDTPAYVAVQLFADATLPPGRRSVVEIVVHGQPPRRMVLVEVLTRSRHLAGDVVSLTVEPNAGTARRPGKRRPAGVGGP